jgi:hypothetical protein
MAWRSLNFRSPSQRSDFLPTARPIGHGRRVPAGQARLASRRVGPSLGTVLKMEEEFRVRSILFFILWRASEACGPPPRIRGPRLAPHIIWWRRLGARRSRGWVDWTAGTQGRRSRRKRPARPPQSTPRRRAILSSEEPDLQPCPCGPGRTRPRAVVARASSGTRPNSLGLVVRPQTEPRPITRTPEGHRPATRRGRLSELTGGPI